MQHFPEFAVKRPIGVTMLFCIVLVLGAISLRELSIDLLPNITFPALAVVTSYEGVGPEDVETLLTKPIEEAVARVGGIKEVRSQSLAGLSIVMVEFRWGTRLDFAAQEVRDRLDLIVSSLPEDAGTPVLLKMNLKNWPVAYLGLSGRRSLAELERMAKKQIKPEIEKTVGVAKVDLAGSLDEEVQVILNEGALEKYRLSPIQVAQAIREGNVNGSGGILKEGEEERILKLKGEVQNLDALREVSLESSQGDRILLKDIAQIRLGYHEVSGKVRLRGKPAIGLIVYKQSSENSVKLMDRLRKRLAAFSSQLPPDIQIVYSWDQARLIKLSVNSVKSSAYWGMLFTLLIVWFFLRSVRATIVVVSAIPFSIIGTFVLMYFTGVNINVMSLAGLALGVGVIVDNSIVVLENIYRLLEMGTPLQEACIRGTQEVIGAIAASTWTNIVVFLPIAWVSGIVGELFRELALTVAFSLSVSLLFAITLSPMLAYLLFRVRYRAPKAQSLGVLDTAHHRVLTFSLAHPLRVAFIAIGLMGLTLVALKNIGKEFLPAQQGGDMMVKLKLPVGTSLSSTDLVAQRMESYLEKFPEIAGLFLSAGTLKSDREGQAFGMGSTDTNEALLWAHLLPGEIKNQRSKSEIQALTLKMGKNMPHTEVQVIGGEELILAGSLGKSIELTLTGDDLDALKSLANRSTEILKSIPGVLNVESSLQYGKPEVQLAIDRKKAADRGVAISQAAQTLQIAFKGRAVTTWRHRGEDLDIFARLRPSDRKNMEKLLRLTVPSSRAGLVPLGAISSVTRGASIQKLERLNHHRMIQLSADISGRDLGSVTSEVSQELQKINWPDGYSFSFGGKMEQMKEGFQKLSFAMVVAILLVYMVLAFQFESFLHPFVIMFAIPFGFIGSILFLYLFHSTLSVPSMMGLIMVAGIGVNDAIVLLDFVRQLRGEGIPRREAILKASALRLRPVLLTSATTIIAMVPTAMGMGGKGGEMNIPLAYAIIGGLTASTLLTLVLVPTIYRFIDDLQEGVKRKLRA